MNVNNFDISKGFIDLPISNELNINDEVNKLKKEKNAVILAHYYQRAEIQDIADFTGDSLALAQWAAKTNADIIVLCGVHFMAETAKILSPTKKVLIPDLNAGCSLADSCNAVDFAEFKSKHSNHTVISYVNTTTEIKALTDIVVTSTNAKAIVDSLPKDEKIIFGPDRNLGNYINSITGREMLLWDGACHVHEQFSLEKILALKKAHPDAEVLAHPECKKVILTISDFIGSTSALLKYSSTSKSNSFIVATESGILHEMQKANPDKQFIPAPPNDSSCGCNDCNFMKMITLEKLYNTLKFELPEVHVEESMRLKAVKSITRMLEISAQLGM